MTSKYLVKEQLAARYGMARFKLVQMGYAKMQSRNKVLMAIEAIVGKGTEQQLLDEFLRPSEIEPVNRVTRKEYRSPISMQQAAQRARAAQPELISINGRVRHEYI
jgi:hypothetical protein